MSYNIYNVIGVSILLGKITRADKSCVICPIDSSFTLPDKVIRLSQNPYEQLAYVPEYSEIDSPLENMAEAIAHGIKYGVAVQKYSLPQQIYIYPVNHLL